MLASEVLEQILAEGGEINMAVRGIKWPGRANLVVSLVAVHKGPWVGSRVLDGKLAQNISAYLEDDVDAADPVPLRDNVGKLLEGSKWVGDGFLLAHQQANSIIAADPASEIVLPAIINGDEINTDPEQKPGRRTVYFSDWPRERASEYRGALKWLVDNVKEYREAHTEEALRRKWWCYKRPTPDIYAAIRMRPRCLVAAATTKFLNFSAVPTNYIFTHALKVFTTDRWDLYAIVQSTIHEVWARKYSGSLETRLRYSPSDCFETFAFPEGLWQVACSSLAAIGERYHEHRKSLMLSLWLGLTDIYNLFHSRDLSPAKVGKISKKSAEESERGYAGILELRRLHVELDVAVRHAYGWQNLPLDHDFYQVETLPENDRVRYTISPSARKELLRRLLALNHSRAAAEETAPKSAKPKRRKKSALLRDDVVEMFANEAADQ
jgi:hypothetical protein